MGSVTCGLCFCIGALHVLKLYREENPAVVTIMMRLQLSCSWSSNSVTAWRLLENMRRSMCTVCFDSADLDKSVGFFFLHTMRAQSPFNYRRVPLDGDELLDSKAFSIKGRAWTTSPQVLLVHTFLPSACRDPQRLRICERCALLRLS